MAGRKRIPTKLHLLKGTAQPCRMNKNEPVAPSEPPCAAVSMNTREVFWYRVIVGRIQSIGVASRADSEAVMILAKRYAEIELLDVIIKKHGHVYQKKELGQITLKANPAVAQRSEAFRHAQSLLAEFGLSPSSRTKVSKTDDDKEHTNPFEDLR